MNVVTNVPSSWSYWQGVRRCIDRAVSYVSEHAGAGGDTGLCVYCICTFVYTCNQMDSSRSNETVRVALPR